MKILRLRLAGFGPYKNEQVVDFERFDDDGIFLITGKTGAGKSSILDAICFALYNTVPRYDKREAKLRSDHCDVTDPTFVELEFTLRDTLYRVRRSPEFERPKLRGEGMATAAATALLEIDQGDGWRGLAAKPGDVGREISRILPIRADQFLQVILLAQNRFQRFLLSQTDERRAVLRTLFGTERFETLESTLAERNRELTARVQSVRHQLDTLASSATTLLAGTAEPEAASPDSASEGDSETSSETDRAWFADAMALLESRSVTAATAADSASSDWSIATAALHSAEGRRTLQDRRAAATARLRELGARDAEITTLRDSVKTAHRAAALWPFITAHRSASETLERARRDESLARERWLQASGAPDGSDLSISALQATVDGALAQRGALGESLAEEKSLAELERRLTRLADSSATASAKVTEIERRTAQLPTEIEKETARIDTARVAAAAVGPAREDVARIGSALAAAQRAEQLDNDHAAALVDQKRASTANTEAAAAYDRLLDRRLEGNASELAAALVSGEPCLVCGSVTHPAPAPGDGTAITEADVAASAAARSSMQQKLAVADTAAQRLATELAAARGEAGGLALDELSSALVDRRGALAEVEKAASDVVARERHRSAMLDEQTAMTDALRSAVSELESARVAVAEQRAVATAIEARVADSRGEFASIAERIADLDQQLAVARALLSALESTSERESQLVLAAATLDEELTASQFDSAADVEAARLTAVEIERVDAGIRDHFDAVAAAQGTLAEAELADLPADPIDLAPLRIVVDESGARRDERMSWAHGIAARRDQLAETVIAADVLFDTSADLIAEQALVRELAEAVAGGGSNTKRIRLETYVLAAKLEQIIAAANLRLATMTSGRYVLELDDDRQHRNVQTGLGLRIRDAHTGRARATHSLSGGETFLASLALALGLAEIVSQQAGGIALDTLFVDEGFGSLDSETLEIAMSTLDSLRSGGRTVGLISHVDSMKEQIPAKLEIVVGPGGYSTIA